MHLLDSLPGRTVSLEGRPFLYFSGTSYLGMGRHPVFRQFLREGIRRYGTHYSSSRISNVQLAVFAEAEQQLASQTGSEAALTFSSGFLAGQAVARCLQEAGPFLYAPRTHPALWLTNTNPAPDEPFGDWVRRLPARVASLPAPVVVLLANSLDPLYAEPHSFSWLPKLPRDKRFIVVIDDSHGLGVTGSTGGGVWEDVPAPPHVELIVTSSLGKALGLPGGVVLARRHRVEELKKSPFFTAGSPIPPAYLHAYLQAGSLYAELRHRLLENVGLFHAYLPEAGMNILHWFGSYPAFHVSDNGLHAYLYARRVLASHFPYPSAAHPPITRLILSALHTSADITTLARHVGAYAAQH